MILNHWNTAIIITSACFFHQQAEAQLISFDDMGSANAYIFNDFKANHSRIQGKLLVGGNATLTHYSVAATEGNLDTNLVVNRDAKIVGGNVTGKASIGGSLKTTKTRRPALTDNDYNFNQSHFIDLSNNLKNASNGHYYNQANQSFLYSNTNQSTIIVNLAQQDFERTWGISVHGNEWSRVVLNISGSNITVNSLDWAIMAADRTKYYHSSNILFNFYEATQVHIKGNLYGSVLAPNAAIFGQHGLINGQLIAKSFTGGTQLNKSTFNIDTLPAPCQGSACYPDYDVSSPISPAILVIIALMLLLLAKNTAVKNAFQH
jgi:choice-of-anchor A domain-containing protein